MFSAALAARVSIDFSYKNLTVDSFDSSNPAYSTSGLYDPAKRKDGGDVATIDGAVNVGNAQINGRIRTGTKGAFSFGPHGFVGPLDWYGPGLYSEEWYRKDFRFVIPDVPAPFTDGFPPIPLSGDPEGWSLGSGDYFVAGDFALNNRVLMINGDARFLVSGSFSMSGALSEIRINSGASLQLYVGGTNGAITRVTPLDPLANATVFQYYGLPGNTTVFWGGTQSLLGTIYAPSATLKIAFGGTDVIDIQGACAANAILLNAHCFFHFDENLAVRGPQR